MQQLWTTDIFQGRYFDILKKGHRPTKHTLTFRVALRIQFVCGLPTVPLSCRKTLTADKGGIEITSDPVAKGGKVQFTVDRLRELFIVRFCIVNKGPNCVHFTYYTVLHKIRCFTLEDERRVSRARPLLLCPGETANNPLCFHWRKESID